jgi:hypothetical protein
VSEHCFLKQFPFLFFYNCLKKPKKYEILRLEKKESSAPNHSKDLVVHDTESMAGEMRAPVTENT